MTDRNGNQTFYKFSPLGNWTEIRETTNRNVRPSDPHSYIEYHQYDDDGQRLTITHHERNSVEYTFGVEDGLEEDRLQQGNLRQVIRRPGPKKSGDQIAIVTKYSYEPIYNQMRTVIEARGHDPKYRPSIVLAEEKFPNDLRYKTTYIFDYQEGRRLRWFSKEDR